MSQGAPTVTRPHTRNDEEDTHRRQGQPSIGRSAPRNFPAGGRGGHSHSRQGYDASPTEHSASSYDSSRHHNVDSRGPSSYPAERSTHRSGSGGRHGDAGNQHGRASGGGSSGRRYGQWPPPGSSPADFGGLPRSGSSGGSSGRAGSWQGGAGTSRHSSSSTRPGGRNASSFTFNWPAYMERVQLQQAMKRGQVFRAKFRVNAANKTEGFCTLEGLPSDLLVRGDVNQNRAVEGDEVAVLAFKLTDWFKVYKEQEKLAELGLLPEGDDDPLALAEKLTQLAIDANDDQALAAAQSPWLAAGSSRGALKKLQEILTACTHLRVTGKIVSILEPSRKRDAIVGVLLPVETALAASPPAGPNPGPVASAAAAGVAAGTYQGCLMLFPLDPRLPKCIIGPDNLATLPQELKDEAASAEVTKRTFVTACITEWPTDSPFPVAEVRQSLGPSDDIEAGTKALLAQEGVVEEDFGLEVYACLPKTPWSIAPADMAGRADFTSWRIFSIDPMTARDLDDALSIQPLGGGRWRVGVHIADVASFVKPNTALDQEAQARGTSVYLVQRVIPMLPRLLCEELCSLHPGYPRFAFSIVWEVDEDGHIYKEWAGRSVISSRAKLAYPMVQQMIEGCFDPAPWGVQLHEGATWDEIKYDCLALHGVASRLRDARFKSGALRLNNTRLFFALDTGGNPVSASPYMQTAANFLVEEYMLLANMRVAAIIAWAFPKHALLRRHPPPSTRKIQELVAVGEKLGVKVDYATAGALALSLQAMRDACKDDATSQALMLLATKPMQLATYFCTYGESSPLNWRHYALAMGHYTHFTSPIRRYPDVIVHRLLAAALELQEQQQQPDTSDLLTAPMVDRAELPAPVDYSGSQYDPAFAAVTAAREAAEMGLAPAAGFIGSNAGSNDGSDAGSSDGDSEADPKSDAENDLGHPDATAMLQKHQLPSAELVQRIAEHSNDTKTSARQVSDGSLKLYLCIMLRDSPVVTMAVATGVGGDKYFQAYLPELGCETRITLDIMGVPLVGTFDSTTETLTITYKEQEEFDGQQLDPGSAAGRRMGFQQQQQHRSSGSLDVAEREKQEQQLAAARLRLNHPCFDLRVWLDHMQGKVINRDHIPRAELPLQIQQFTQFPVVASSYSNRATEAIEDLSCKLWVPCGAADEDAAAGYGVAAEPAAPDAATAAAAAQVVPSAMAVETLYED